jgi:tetratricopeptide (TPR) repeat protein
VLLLYLAFGFKLWMLFDAVRRRVSPVWLVIVIIPLGDWIYFFAVKLADFNVRPATTPEQDTGPSLDDLRQAEQESPSFHNRLRLGWALLDAEHHDEARGYFELCLRTHGQDRDARYGLALCELAANNRDAAIEALQALIERTFGYDDYNAALRLAEARFDAEQTEEALELLEMIVRDSHRLDHQVLLARYQLRADQRAEAEATLDEALATFESQPDYLRRRNGAVATDARRLLRTLRDDEPDARPSARPSTD